MAHATDIVAYTYRADLYCPDCIVDLVVGHESAFHLDSTEQRLNRLAAKMKICREDERTFDSGDFPKVVFRDMLEDDEHCGHCHTKLGE